jgi:DUF2970 family protein
MSKPTILQVIKSVIAAGIGVQSNKNREVDFQNNSPISYVIVGLIGTALFVMALVFIVSIVVN